MVDSEERAACLQLAGVRTHWAGLACLPHPAPSPSLPPSLPYSFYSPPTYGQQVKVPRDAILLKQLVDVPLQARAGGGDC